MKILRFQRYMSHNKNAWQKNVEEPIVFRTTLTILVLAKIEIKPFYDSFNVKFSFKTLVFVLKQL